MATPILVPPLGQTTDTVVFAAWYKQVGESVQIGEPLFAIETDKATLDIEAQAAGILQVVTASAGDEVAVLSTIGMLAADGEVLTSATVDQQAQTPHSVTAGVELAQKVATPVATARQTGSSRFFISPRAKRFAEDNHVEWRNLSGTGSQGAVVERDVRTFLYSKGQVKARAQELPADKPSAPLVAVGSVSVITSQVALTHVTELLVRFTKHDRIYSIDDIIISMLLRALQHFPVTNDCGDLMTIGLVRFEHIGSTVQVLQIPGTARILQVKQARNQVQPIRVTENPQVKPLNFAYINLDELHLDSVSSIPGIHSVPLLQLGRVHRRSDGSMEAQINLSFTQHSIDFNRAVMLLGNIVRLIEDPDLLY
jgi:hypothetical protein